MIALDDVNLAPECLTIIVVSKQAELRPVHACTQAVCSVGQAYGLESFGTSVMSC